MTDFFQVSPEAARSFMAERARMRASRIKWLEEHEKLTPYKVGDFSTPFEIGCQRYEGEYPDKPIEPRTHEDPAEALRLLDGIDAILAEADQHDRGAHVSVLVSGTEQHAFLMGDADRPPHPAIGEGEDYGEYYARVSRAYEREAGAGSSRGTDAVDGGVRQSAGADSTRERGADPAGTGDRQPDGPMLDCDADGVQPGATAERSGPDGDPPDAAVSSEPDARSGTDAG